MPFHLVTGEDVEMRALLVIDIQNDFLPGGALGVPQGDEVIGFTNDIMDQYDWVVATQDWHPCNHGSFASQHPGKNMGEFVMLGGISQVLWPDHCVQETTGAAFAESLRQERLDYVVRKGTHREIDSYSGFFDSARGRGTGLIEWLRAHQVDQVELVGLATDFCVKATAMDAVELGLRTTVLKEGVRGVELHRGDCQRAFDAMSAAGVLIR